MKTNYIVVPDTGQHLYQDTLLILSRFPNIRWILKHGEFRYQNSDQFGWYLESTPAGAIIPATDDNLNDVTHSVSNAHKGAVTSSHIHQIPQPDDGPVQPPEDDDIGPPSSNAVELLDRAMITVDTLRDRNNLAVRAIPDGKVVRVNDVDGRVRYYEWSEAEANWIDLQASGLSSLEWGTL